MAPGSVRFALHSTLHDAAEMGRSRQKRRLDSMYSMCRRKMTNRMSLSRVLASTHRRAAAADTRMHSWMAFMLDQKQPFVLTCTSRRPKLAQALASMPETMVHSRMCMLLPREIALTTCALHVCRGNGLLLGSRPNAFYVPSFEIRKRRR